MYSTVREYYAVSTLEHFFMFRWGRQVELNILVPTAPNFFENWRPHWRNFNDSIGMKREKLRIAFFNIFGLHSGKNVRPPCSAKKCSGVDAALEVNKKNRAELIENTTHPAIMICNAVISQSLGNTTKENSISLFLLSKGMEREEAGCK